jgi:hypothetical protein
MISIDATTGQEMILDDQLVGMAEVMAESGYIGSVCGCWLGLLLLIPSIFDLGKSRTESWPVLPSEEKAQFDRINLQLTRWKPNPLATPDVALTGSVFQQAMLVYLYTAIMGTSTEPNDTNEEIIRSAISKTLLYLGQINPWAPVNTNLCWPIAVVGSCVSDPDHQQILCARLDHMMQTIGIGNMRRTRELLQYMWHHQLTGPWGIPQAMRDSGIFISFA